MGKPEDAGVGNLVFIFTRLLYRVGDLEGLWGGGKGEMDGIGWCGIGFI